MTNSSVPNHFSETALGQDLSKAPVDRRNNYNNQLLFQTLEDFPVIYRDMIVQII